MIRFPRWVCAGFLVSGGILLSMSYPYRPGLEGVSNRALLRAWMWIWGSLGFVLLWAFEPLLESLCHRLGGLFLAIATLGRARAEPLDEAFPFPWHGVLRSAGLHWVVQSEIATALGMVALFAGAVLALRVFS